MAHEITIRASGKAEMAYVGEKPWHKLGAEVTKGASLETWQREAGMDWEALEAPVQFSHGGITHNMPEKKVIFRGDNGMPLSVMGEGYNIVQPREVLEFFRDLTEQGGWHIHTAGTLNEGRKLWVMASNGERGDVVRGDHVIMNLLLATSLDGTAKTTGAFVNERVVCANTLRVALNERGNLRHSISHRSMFDAAAIKETLGLATDTFGAFMKQARTLAEKPVTPEEARLILKGLFEKPSTHAAQPLPVDKAEVTPLQGASGDFARLMLQMKGGAPAPKDHRNVAKVLDLFNGAGRGAQHAGVAGTAWGLLNAVTEFVDHQAARNDNTRFDSAQFGRGDDLKQTAFAALLAR